MERVTEADVAERTLIEQHSARNTVGLKIPMPQGRIVPAAPYLGTPYPGDDSTMILGDPAKFIKKPKPGLYLWRVQDDPVTGAMVESQRMTPVMWDEMDRSDPDKIAEIVQYKSPSGDFVKWRRHALFHMAPKMADRYYYQWERYAGKRLAAQAAEFQEAVYEASQGAAKGVVRRTS
jgi:hypothetical protein